MPRPRKAGMREPNGRLSRSDRGTYWQRERDALAAGAADHRLGTPLGVILRAGKITSSQFDAGMWFAEARTAADAALSLPSRTARAQDMNSLGGSPNGEEDPDKVSAKRRAVEVYDKACSYVGHGSRQLAALELVVVYQRRPDTYEQMLALIDGLDRLIAYRSGRRAA